MTNSVLGVRNIQHTNGTDAMTIATNGGVTFSNPQAGSIIQIQYAQKIDTGSVSLSAQTYTALHSDLEVTITPTSTSSVIRLEGQIFGEHGNSGNVYNASVFFYRNTTRLGAPAAGNRFVGVGILPRTYEVANADSTPEFAMYSFYDTPSTTSAITYKLGMIVWTAETFYINRTVSDTDQGYYERGTSHITATEIAG